MNVLIIEDEPLVARRLTRLLTKIAPTWKLACADSLDDGESYLTEKPIDVLFLDLNLHNQDGFALLRTMIRSDFLTVVVSANTARAIEAFELGVTDFVGKPFDEERLTLAVSRVRAAYRSAGLPSLAVRQGSTLKAVLLEDIHYIRAEGHYCSLVLKSGGEILYEKHLEHVLSQLPDRFIRLHRSYCVCIGEIVALHTRGGSKYEAELQNNIFLPVGRTRYQEVKQQFIAASHPARQ